ncbi:MAG: hypothetical protein AAGI11_15155 [Pseudomonadota bacterium]
MSPDTAVALWICYGMAGHICYLFLRALWPERGPLGASALSFAWPFVMIFMLVTYLVGRK